MQFLTTLIILIVSCLTQLNGNADLVLSPLDDISSVLNSTASSNVTFQNVTVHSSKQDEHHTKGLTAIEIDEEDASTSKRYIRLFWKTVDSTQVKCLEVNKDLSTEKSIANHNTICLPATQAQQPELGVFRI